MIKIKLAFNATSMLSPLTGIGKYTFYLAKELKASKEVDVSFFYGSSWDDRVRTPSSARAASKKKSFVKSYVPFSYQALRIVQSLMFKKESRRNELNIYHDPGYLLFPFQGKKVITVHDVSFVRYPEAHPKDRIKRMEKYFPEALNKADAIITDSYFSASELAACFTVDEKKIHPIHLGVDAHYQPRNEEECKACLEHYALYYRRYILVVGTLEPRKNLEQVLIAYQSLSASLREQYPLVIAGMKGWGTSPLEKKMEALKEAGQLLLLGYVPEKDLPILYSGASLFVYPSLYEGFGLPPLEAMASGTPVVTSNQASLPEVVGDAGIQVSPDDPERLSSVMLEVLTKKAQFESMREKGLKQASKFTWKKCAEQTINVYKSLLETES